MNKKQFRKEPEHRLRCLDNKPRDRGDDTNTNVVKNSKNKMSNDPQVKSETKNFYDCLRDQIDTKDLVDYSVKVEIGNEKDIRDRGDAEKNPQEDKKLDDKKPSRPKYMMSQMANPYGIRLSEKNLRKIHEKMIKVVEPLDIEKRRKLYKMYTFRKSSDDSNMNHEEKKDCSTKTGSPVEACQERSIYPQNQEVHEPPLVHIKHENCTKKHKTIDESDEECFSTEGEPSPVPASSTEPGLKSKTQVCQEGVQTELPSLPASKRPSAPTLAKKQKTLFLKTRHASPPARPAYKRKPIIRTLMTREGDSTRIYKAVSFDEQKKKAPLKIHVGPKRMSRWTTRTPRVPRAAPTPHTPYTPRTSGTPSSSHSQKSKQNSSSHTSSDSANVSLQIVKHKTSPCNIRELVMNRECKNKSRRLRHTSPEIAVAPPPVTEVAKWAPQSVNEHTKPYYEAWVNTTLAAISSDNEKMRKEKEKIIHQMQERLQYQASMSEDDLSDTRYTDKIVITVGAKMKCTRKTA